MAAREGGGEKWKKGEGGGRLEPRESGKDKKNRRKTLESKNETGALCYHACRPTICRAITLQVVVLLALEEGGSNAHLKHPELFRCLLITTTTCHQNTTRSPHNSQPPPSSQRCVDAAVPFCPARVRPCNGAEKGRQGSSRSNKHHALLLPHPTPRPSVNAWQH